LTFSDKRTWRRKKKVNIGGGVFDETEDCNNKSQDLELRMALSDPGGIKREAMTK